MLCIGIATVDPLADAAKDIPAIPSTDAVLFGRFALKLEFVCGTAEFLSAFALQNAQHLASQNARQPTLFVAAFIRLW
jgi:hypothetical protein